MQLNDLLEEHTISSICAKTNISEYNLEALIEENFEKITKVKTLGFISILEREYGVDLGKFRQSALEYYAANDSAQSITVGLPVMDERKGRSKWVMVIALALLGYASWYFLTQFDKKNLSAMLPFQEEQVEVEGVEEKNQTLDTADLSINHALNATKTETTGIKNNIAQMSIEAPDLNVNKILSTVLDVEESSVESVEVTVEELDALKNIALIPERRLWFGMIQLETGKRDHHSISGKYEIDVVNKSWLIATSSAPFSLSYQENVQEFNDAKEHYFKVSASGIEHLSKTEYVTQGGYKKW